MRSKMRRALSICFFVLTLAGFGAAHKNHVPGDDCSREKSRTARACLKEIVLPVLKSESFTLPASCPWLESRDYFSIHEKHKMGSGHHWVCGFNDSKAFRSEAFLDLHHRNRHADQIPKGANVCLADWCDVLACDVFQNPKQWRCPLDRLAKAQHRCHQVLDQCFPKTDRVAARIHARLETDLCERLTCEHAPSLFRMKRLRHAIGHIAYWFLMGLLLIFLVFYYVTVLVYSKEDHSKGDLRRVTARRAGTRKAEHLPGGIWGLRIAIWRWAKRTMGTGKTKRKY